MTVPPGLHDLAALLRQGDITPTDLIEQALEKAGRSGAVFISLCADSARAQAEAATARRRRGTPLGPLDGIPLAWKDVFDIAGTVTTAGSRALADAPPASADCPLVTHATAAGLIPIGKTNLSEFAFSGLGTNPHYGTPTFTDADGIERIPGGSSSGSAMAVRQGIVPLAMGTDTAGSVRIPAAFNGLVGLRPSLDRYDLRGVFPLAVSFDTAGPLAHTVSDIQAMDAVLRGLAPVPPPATDLGSLHLCLDEALLDDERVQPAVREGVLATVDAWVQLGVRVSRVRLRAVHATAALIADEGWLGAVEALAVHRQRLDGPARGLIDPNIVKRLDLARQTMTDERVQRLRRARERLADDIRAELGEAILVVPSVAHTAPALAEVAPDTFAAINGQTLRLTMIGSFLGLPGLALPALPADGRLPVGLTLHRLPGGDDRLMAACLVLARVAGLTAD